MYYYHKYFLFLALIQFLFCISDEKKIQQGNNVLSLDNFGPIKVKHEMLALCKGPKHRDCCRTTLNTSNNYELMEFVLNIPTDVQFVKVKIDSYFNQNNESAAKPDIVKWLERPCDHFFLGPVLRALLKVGPGCIVKKGTYRVALNATAQFYNLYGDKFFYGSFKTQCTAVAKDCNIICLLNHVNLERLN